LALTWLFLVDCLVAACLAIFPLAFRWRSAMCGAPWYWLNTRNRPTLPPGVNHLFY